MWENREEEEGKEAFGGIISRRCVDEGGDLL